MAAAENIDADQPDGARDAVTILIEQGEGGIAQDGHVHFHAVEDFLQRRGRDQVGADDLRHLAAQRRERRAHVRAADFLAPLAELAPLFPEGQFGRIGHVVDHAAEGVEDRHRVPLRLGQRGEREREIRLGRLRDGFASGKVGHGFRLRGDGLAHEVRALRKSTAMSALPTVGRWFSVS